MERYVECTDEVGGELGQIRNLLDLKPIQSLQIIPQRVLKRVPEALRIFFYKAGAKQGVELVEVVRLLKAAVDYDFYDFPLLLFLEVQSLALLECLLVVCGSHYS